MKNKVERVGDPKPISEQIWDAFHDPVFDFGRPDVSGREIARDIMSQIKREREKRAAKQKVRRIVNA